MPTLRSPDYLISKQQAGNEKIDDHVNVRVYKPKIPRHSKLPVGIFIHGGGWICGDLESEDPQCRIIARDAPCVLVSVEYRLAPQHKMPIQIDDCLAAFEWVC